jgi:hypothetical protein
MSDLPSASVTVEENGLALVGTAPDQIHVAMGCSSKGPYLNPYSFGNIPDFVAARGCGKGVKGAAYTMAKTQAPVVFVRLPVTPIAATKSAVNADGITGTVTATLTGTPNAQYSIKFVFVAAAVAVGVAGITYKWSKDGGETWSAVTPLGTATTATLTGTGLTANFVSGNTPAPADYFTATTTAPSPAVLPLTFTADAATTAVLTATGTPEDEYDVVLEFLVGGPRGTPGIVYRYSLDGGRSFTRALQLGAATSIALLDGKSEPSGVTVNIGAGDLTAGDELVFATTAPEAQDSDITLALNALRQSPLRWSFIHYVGTANAVHAGNVGASLANYAASGKYTWAACSARHRGAAEPDSEWRADLVSDVENFADSRIAIGAGRAQITCPITGRQNKRPVMWTIVPRLLARPMEEDPGRVGTGALSSDVRIHDDDNLLVEHDARFNPDLHAARYATLRTHDDEEGVFITRGNTMSAEDGDIGRIALRRVMDLGAAVFRKAMQKQLEIGIKVNAKTKPNPGCIREVDARKIEREIYSALYDELIATGRASSVSVQLSRTDPVLTNGGKLTCQVRIVPLAYVDQFDGTIAYENPKLTALQEE